jgi:hypothetical protein
MVPIAGAPMRQLETAQAAHVVLAKRAKRRASVADRRMSASVRMSIVSVVSIVAPIVGLCLGDQGKRCEHPEQRNR